MVVYLYYLYCMSVYMKLTVRQRFKVAVCGKTKVSQTLFKNVWTEKSVQNI